MELITIAWLVKICKKRSLIIIGFSHLVKATKSAILSWGLCNNVFTVDEIVKLSLLELGHQAKIWGNRREHHEYSEIILKKKLLICNLFLKVSHK